MSSSAHRAPRPLLATSVRITDLLELNVPEWGDQMAVEQRYRGEFIRLRNAPFPFRERATVTADRF
jgi:hypothetical protein